MFAVAIFERPCTRSGQDQWQEHEHVREGVSNKLTFATADEAKAYGADLASRWFGFDHWDVVDLDEKQASDELDRMGQAMADGGLI